MAKKKYVSAFTIFLSLTFSVSAFGHTTLIKTSPEGNSTIHLLPQKVSLDFDDELIDLGTGYELTVLDPNGSEVTTGEISIALANISRSLKPVSTQGQYLVSYRVVSNDGHVVKGEYNFALASQVTPTTSTSASSEIAPRVQPTPGTTTNNASKINASVVAETKDSGHLARNENFFTRHRTHITWTLIAIALVVGFFFYRRNIE